MLLSQKYETVEKYKITLHIPLSLFCLVLKNIDPEREEEDLAESVLFLTYLICRLYFLKYFDFIDHLIHYSGIILYSITSLIKALIVPYFRNLPTLLFAPHQNLILILEFYHLYF